MQLPNYSIEYTPTKPSAGGALLYISSRTSHKPWTDLKMYAPGKLESVFKEIICPNISYLNTGCIYRYPKLHNGEFNSNYISSFYTHFQKIL